MAYDKIIPIRSRLDHCIHYVLNPETQVHQFSKTLEEHEQWVEKFRGAGQ